MLVRRDPPGAPIPPIEISCENLGGSFDNCSSENIFKATIGGSFGSISFGFIGARGVSQDFVLNDLSVVGSLAGGGDLGDVDLIYVPVPEPSALLLVLIGFVLVVVYNYRVSRVPFLPVLHVSDFLLKEKAPVRRGRWRARARESAA